MTTTQATTSTSPAQADDRRSARANRQKTLAPYVFVSPFYLLFLVFMFIPILIGAYLSLTEWAGFGPPEFVGLANYQRLFQDQQFYLSLANTLFFVIVSLFIVVPLAMFVAMGLNAQGLRGRDAFRLIYFTPMVLSPIIIVLIFQLFLDGNFGLFNALLRAVFGLGGVDWLGDPMWAKVSVAILLAWRWTGYLVIFFLAGLQGVPKELHEAAQIDGANAFQRFREVTLPALRPVTAFVIVTSFVGTAQIFEEPYLLTNGGPNFSTLTVAIFVFRAAFQRQEIGYASAAGVVLFIIVFIIAQVATRLLGVGKDNS